MFSLCAHGFNSPSLFKLCLRPLNFSRGGSTGPTAADLAFFVYCLCVVMWSVFSSMAKKTNNSCQEKCLGLSRGHPWKPVILDMPNLLLCVSVFFFNVRFVFVFHFWVIRFLSLLYSMQYSYPIQSTNSNNNKRESCQSAICHLLSWIQQLSVGCRILFFLIVADFLVQFYATFTWMFMTICCHKNLEIL